MQERLCLTDAQFTVFLELFGFGSLNDLPDFEALQAEGALAEPELGDEMREILGIGDPEETDDSENNEES